MAILPWNLRLDPTHLDVFSIAEEDKIPIRITLPNGEVQTKMITQRENAWNLWRDTLKKKNDWQEFLRVYPHSHELKDLVEKPKFDNEEMNIFYKKNINEINNDISELPNGSIHKEINKNKINKHLAERNLGKKIKGQEWNTLSNQERNKRISEVEILKNPTRYQKEINDLLKSYETAHHKQTYFNTEIQKRASQPGFEFLKYGQSKYF